MKMLTILLAATEKTVHDDISVATQHIRIPEWLWAIIIGGVVMLLMKLLWGGLKDDVVSLKAWKEECLKKRMIFDDELQQRCNSRFRDCDAKDERLSSTFEEKLESAENRIIAALNNQVADMRRLFDEKFKNLELKFEKNILEELRKMQRSSGKYQ